LDSITRSAAATGAARAASHSSDLERENFMVGVVELLGWSIRCAESTRLGRGRTRYEYRGGRSAKPAARACASVWVWVKRRRVSA
jgi:hypothetical protein